MFNKKLYEAKLLILHKGDFDRLRRLYGKKKATPFIRELVHTHIEQLDKLVDDIMKGDAP